MKFFVYILSFLFLLNVGELKADKHISTHNGLSNKRTFCIEKDNTGFIWIATRTGIDRYDGTHIKQYKLRDTEGTADMAGRINMLIKDKDGEIWCYTNNGHIFQYDRNSDSFILRINVSEFDNKADLFLNGVYFTDNDNMFIYGSFGLLYYTISEKNTQRIEKLEEKNISIIKEIGPSKYAVGTQQGLYIAQSALDNNRLTVTILEEIELNERIQSLYLEKFDSLLVVGTYSGKVFFYDVKNKLFKDIVHDFKASIRDIKSYDNTLYIATDGNALIRLDEGNKSVQTTFNHFEKERKENRPYAIYNLLIDDNRLWVATYTNGIYLYDDNLPLFRFIQPNSSGSVLDNAVNTVLEDSNLNIWFGTNNGISRYNTKSRQWNHLLNDMGNDRYNIMTLCEDAEGNIWAGGVLGVSGICIDSKTLKIKEHLHLPDKAHISNVSRTYCIYNDSNNNIWFGGFHSPLTCYNPKTKETKEYKLNYINTIVEKNKTLMVGTTQGLYILDKKIDNFVQVVSAKKTGSAMSSFINAIYEDNLGITWLATECGLLKYDRNNDNLESYCGKGNALSSSIYTILPDARNRLWIGTEVGLVCFDPIQNETINFGSEEGLIDERFKARSAYHRRNGELVFGTTNGAIYFTPEIIDRLNIKNKLVITDFYISHKPVFPSHENSPLSAIADETKSLKLKYNYDTFSFEFTNINLTNPHRTRFEWKLEGYDKDWIRQDEANGAYYTNVQPGDYVFKLRLINKDNLSEIESRSIPVTITPPIWGTVFAKIIYTLLVIGLLWIILQLIKIRMEKAHSTEKLQFFTHTAHELKTPITLIKGPLNKMKENSNLSDEDKLLLDLALKNTNRLHKIVTQLFDIQKTRNSNIGLSLSPFDVIKYTKDRIYTFQQLAIEKNINLRFVSEVEELIAWFDVDKMDKIMYNLLSNAIKYTPQNGEITVRLSEGKKKWSIDVEDTGIGIPKKAQKNIFKPFFRANNAINVTEAGTGIGLLLSRNLVALHGGTLSFESSENEGSKFKIAFPTGIDHFDKKYCTFFEVKEENKQANYLVEESNSSQKLPIMIVEDNSELRLFLKQSLADKYSVHEAENGVEALRKLEELNPELIISDVMMPEMDGYELCKRIKTEKETSHIPIILLTALDDKENVLKGYEYGADNYITKPFDTSILILTVENTITTRQALRKNLVLPLEQEVNGELSTNPLDKAFIDEVMTIIDRNIDDSDYSIDDLCREIGMSRTSFFNKIKTLTGQGPNDFIRLVRLNRAAKLLKEKNSSVAEAAYSTGFADVKYFSTIFKKHFGISPSKYCEQE